MTLVLARVPALRLLRSRRAWGPIVLWALLAIVSAGVARAHGSPSGADHVMRGSFGFLVLPLLTYAVVSAVHGASGLRRGIRGVVALGAPPRDAALASIGVAVVASAVLCALLAAIVSVLAHGALDPPIATDLGTSLWVGALGGAAYAAYFSVGSAIGQGTLRGLFLAFDFIVGSGSGVGALLTPRGHVHSLLGGALVAEVSQRTSSIVLVLLAITYGVVALLLSRRA
jgi:hypothetical protein